LILLSVLYFMAIFTGFCLHVLLHMFPPRLDKNRIRILNRIENFLKSHFRILIWNQSCKNRNCRNFFCKSMQFFSVYSICYLCCGSGSVAFFNSWIRDPGWKKMRSGIQDPEYGTVNIPDHIFKSLVTIFWVKNTYFFVTGPDPGLCAFLILAPGWKNLDRR
jgi:hypothetical protein